MDPISDMLRSMRLTGGIFLDAELTAPWCLQSKIGPEDCAPFTPEPRQIIAYHYVTAGRLLLKVNGQKPATVQRGEIVVLPRNDTHVIGSALNLRPISADHLIRPNPAGGLAQIIHGGGGERTHIICGFLGNDMSHNGLIAMLPSVMKLEVTEGASGDWIESSLRFAAKEMADGKMSSPAMLAKLAELLFMEAVRRYLAAQPPELECLVGGHARSRSRTRAGSAARPVGPTLDDGRSGRRDRSFTIRLRRTIHAPNWPTADALSRPAAAGSGLGPAKGDVRPYRAHRLSRRLRIRGVVQQGLQTGVWGTARSMAKAVD